LKLLTKFHKDLSTAIVPKYSQDGKKLLAACGVKINAHRVHGLTYSVSSSEGNVGLSSLGIRR